MPSFTEEIGSRASNIVGGNDIARPRLTRIPYSGSLEKFKYNDLTPVIGRELEDLQIRDLLKESDEVIRDLAVTGECICLCPNSVARDVILSHVVKCPLREMYCSADRNTGIAVSQRGVVFLRDQDVTPNEMKDFMLRLAYLAGSVCIHMRRNLHTFISSPFPTSAIQCILKGTTSNPALSRNHPPSTCIP